ncbi:MAG: hypothetical protein J6L61_04860 [Ruminiclostridium sp.]|nr:hypothetical protein [Ruminiclostridium sp.]
MIKVEDTEVYGFEAAIRGMRNPMNSWDRSDSDCKTIIRDNGKYVEDFIGNNDLKLMKQLAKAGSVHAKYRRMITVTCDITAPLYWWKEFDTYKVGTVRNSCSTMHKIAAKEFTLDDFSHEHLVTFDFQHYQINDTEEEALVYLQTSALDILNVTVQALNAYRDLYFKTKDKKYWWQMIQLLPSSYNQRATVQLNYEVLTGIYRWRKDHKLDEWHTFCEWVESLPYSEIITGGSENGED